jgi:hypothetical protein
MKYIWLSVSALLFFTACQYRNEKGLQELHELQASYDCETYFGLTPNTPDFQNCKRWAVHHLQTGIEPDFATFVCDAAPTKQPDPCIEKQQAVYQEMVRVNKEIEALRKEERAQQVANAERMRQEQVNKQKQADHLKCIHHRTYLQVILV